MHRMEIEKPEKVKFGVEGKDYFAVEDAEELKIAN